MAVGEIPSQRLHTAPQASDMQPNWVYSCMFLTTAALHDACQGSRMQNLSLPCTGALQGSCPASVVTCNTKVATSSKQSSSQASRTAA